MERSNRLVPVPVAGCESCIRNSQFRPAHDPTRPCANEEADLCLAHSSVNIPFLNEGMGDADYLYAFQQIVMPIAYEFAPDLVIGALAPSSLPSVHSDRSEGFADPHYFRSRTRSLCRVRCGKG